MKIRQIVRQTRTNTVKIQKWECRPTQCRGGEAAKAKQKEEKIINKIGMDSHTRGSRWSKGDVADFPFKVFIVEHVDINPL